MRINNVNTVDAGENVGNLSSEESVCVNVCHLVIQGFANLKFADKSNEKTVLGILKWTKIKNNLNDQRCPKI